VRRPSGFTIVEIIVVLLLMSILAVTVLGRSVTTSNLDLSSATDKIRIQLRFAQAEAMKLSYETNLVWGIKSAGGQYWMFQGINPDTQANEVRVPGGDYPGTSNRINHADLGQGVTVSGFTVFFDSIGKPYTAYSSRTVNTPLVSQMSITVSAGSDNRSITVTPETGLIR